MTDEAPVRGRAGMSEKERVVAEHTPTEAQVRSCYGAAAITGEGQDRRLAGFDRLMAEIRREAAEKALRESAETLRAEDRTHDWWYADWLEQRAARIARGEGS